MNSTPTQMELDRMINSLDVYGLDICPMLSMLDAAEPVDPYYVQVVSHAKAKKEEAIALQNRLREVSALRPILDKSESIQFPAGIPDPSDQYQKLSEQASDIRMSIFLSFLGSLILFGIGVVCLLITFGAIPYKTEMLHDAFSSFICLDWAGMSEEAMCTCAGVSCGCHIGLIGGLGALISSFSSAGDKMHKLQTVNQQLTPIKQRMESNAAYISNMRLQKEDTRKKITEVVLAYTLFMESHDNAKT